MTEKELYEKTHIEALTKEWMFKHEGDVEALRRNLLIEMCYGDAYRKCKEEMRSEIKTLKKEIDRLNCLMVKKLRECRRLIKRRHEAQNALEVAKKIIREVVTNQSIISAHNPYADKETNEILQCDLERWFAKAEQFLKGDLQNGKEEKEEEK